MAPTKGNSKIQSPSKSFNGPKLSVVVIGASAGGIKALKEFFAEVKSNTKVTFLVVQHLDDSGKEIAFDSLRRLTRLKVKELEISESLRPGIVYTVPPHKLVSFRNGKINLSHANTTAKKLSVVDSLFTSIGKQFRDSAVGVVLSGNANDGAAGVKAINEFGGLTIAQIPNSAEHSSMPESAILTGAIDHIFLPKSMWREIESYFSYVNNSETISKRLALKEKIESALPSICDVLQKSTRHDFKHYKTSTLLRRIQRRMQVLQIESVDDYLILLQDNQSEVDTLFNELLINVTSFFRDKEAFEVLGKEILKPLVQYYKPNQKIRIWVPGCSTGEEAYSIAIMLRELIDKQKQHIEVQIIATDLDSNALNIARRGNYSATIAEHISTKRLEKFFVKKNGRYSIRKELREMCLFSVHNLIVDPPFSQIDLISCRNVLIYMGAHLQKKLFPVFHYALRANGYLFLGTSESLTSHKELFKTINSKHRIAQRKATALKLPSIGTYVQNYLNHFQDVEKVSEADLNLIGQRIALDEMPMKYAIINDECQILSSSAGINKYVQIPEGTFQNNMVKLVAPSLRAALRSAFNQAKKEKRKIVNDSCSIKIDAVHERTAVIVQPMPSLGDLSELYWVAFQSLGSLQVIEANQSSRASAEDDAHAIEQLERELMVVRNDLDKSVQDLEASNEELKSSNEELLSMNEELQSANEELETSKEEVQNSNDALQRANLDLENLLASTQIATVFLDEDFKIRGFTPAIQEIYNIKSGDIGRKITDFTSRALKMPALPELSSSTEKLHNEDEIHLPNGKSYLRRILPYKNSEGQTEGIVVTFVNVTELRKVEGRFLTLANSAPVLIWLADADMQRTWFNKGWLDFTGETAEKSFGWGWVNSIHPDDKNLYVTTYKRHFKEKTPFQLDYRLRHHDGSYRWIGARGVPRFENDGSFDGFIGACLDIHDKVLVERALQTLRDRFERSIEATDLGVWYCDLPFDELIWNKQVKQHFFMAPDARVTIADFYSHIHPEDRNKTEKAIQYAIDNRTPYDIIYRTMDPHNSEKMNWIRAIGWTDYDEDSKPIRFDGITLDVTNEHKQQLELKRAKEDAESAQRIAEAASESKTRFLANMSHEIRTPLSAIIGFNDLLQSNLQVDAESKLFLERISKNAKHLRLLIDELLDLSKIEAEKFEIEYESINIDSVIETVFSTLSLKASEKSVDLSFKWIGEKPTDVVTDPLRFSQILTNIVGNAVKFTKQGHVHVTFKAHDGNLVTLVEDSGIGLFPSKNQLFLNHLCRLIRLLLENLVELVWVWGCLKNWRLYWVEMLLWK